MNDVPFASELELYLTLPTQKDDETKNEEEDLGDYIVRDLLTKTNRSFFNHLEQLFREFRAKAALKELEIESAEIQNDYKERFDRFVRTYLTENNYPLVFHTGKEKEQYTFKYYVPKQTARAQHNIVTVNPKFNNLIVYYAMFVYFFDKSYTENVKFGKFKSQIKGGLKEASQVARNVDFGRMIKKFNEVAESRKTSGLFGFFSGNNYNDFIKLNQYLDKLAREPGISTMFDFTMAEFDQNEHHIINAIYRLCNAFQRNANVNFIEKDPLRKFITYQFFFPKK